MSKSLEPHPATYYLYMYGIAMVMQFWACKGQNNVTDAGLWRRLWRQEDWDEFASWYCVERLGGSVLQSDNDDAIIASSTAGGLFRRVVNVFCRVDSVAHEPHIEASCSTSTYVFRPHKDICMVGTT